MLLSRNNVAIHFRLIARVFILSIQKEISKLFIIYTEKRKGTINSAFPFFKDLIFW